MHVIFLIHGMGVYATGWSKQYQDQLINKWCLYPSLGGKDAFNATFAFQEITYSDCFTNLRNQWKNDSTVVTKMLSGNTGGGLDQTALKVLNDLYGAVTPNTFFATCILDVLLYEFVATVRMQVIGQVASAIAQRLKSGPITMYSVVAHSLGTSVAHDALDVLYSMPIQFANSTTAHLTTGDAQINTLMMVANVSRVLEQKRPQAATNPWDVYASAVKPGPPNTGAICYYYYNAVNQFDPIPKPWPFTIDGTWPTPQIASSGALLNLDATAVAIRDIHEFDFYLENPEVHVPFFRSLTFPGAVSDAELKSQDDLFNAANSKDDLAEIRKYLSGLTTSANPTWTEIIQMIVNFRSNPMGT